MLNTWHYPVSVIVLWVWYEFDYFTNDKTRLWEVQLLGQTYMVNKVWDP